jgi:hypothetical protein
MEADRSDWIEGRSWPKAAIIGIRLERQLSEDKLPSAAIVHDGRR